MRRNNSFTVWPKTQIFEIEVMKNKKVAKKYKDKFNNDNDFTNLIDKLLEEYFDKEVQSL